MLHGYTHFLAQLEICTRLLVYMRTAFSSRTVICTSTAVEIPGSLVTDNLTNCYLLTDWIIGQLLAHKEA